MFSKLALLITVLLVASPATLGAVAPRASGSPTCTNVCPPQDKSGAPLTNSGPLPGNPNGVTCTYRNTGRFCEYNTQTGAIITDHNSGNCPANAAKNCTPAKRNRRDVFDAYYHKREERAARPAPSIPEYMVQRASLKKRKVLTRLD